MNIRVLHLLIVLVVLAGVLAPVSAQENAGRGAACAEFLSAVPDTLEHRRLLTYGDMEAWHTSWNIPRIADRAALDLLDREPRAYWQVIMTKQTTPPDIVGMQTVFANRLRSFWGFDLFVVDRAITTGESPDVVTLLEHNADPEAIAAQLIASGYTAEDIGHGWTLYSIWDDYDTIYDHDAETEMPDEGQRGEFNRIALNGQQMIIARATGVVTGVIATMAGESATLADDPGYEAIIAALDDPLLEGTGDIVGVILQSGLEYMLDPASYIGGLFMDQEEQEALYALYGLDDPANLLTPFMAVGFITAHAESGTYLTLALAYPSAVDVQHAVDRLTEVLPTYTLITNERSLAEEWTLHNAGVAETGSISVVLVTMHIPDPPPTPEDEPHVRTNVVGWMELINRRDTLFLAVNLAAEE